MYRFQKWQHVKVDFSVSIFKAEASRTSIIASGEVYALLVHDLRTK
jgi:hypothetical protein